MLHCVIKRVVLSKNGSYGHISHFLERYMIRYHISLKDIRFDSSQNISNFKAYSPECCHVDYQRSVLISTSEWHLMCLHSGYERKFWGGNIGLIFFRKTRFDCKPQIAKVFQIVVVCKDIYIHLFWQGEHGGHFCPPSPYFTGNPFTRSFPENYRKTSNISRTLVGSKIVDNSDVVGASPVGAAPTTSSFST